MQLGQLSQLGQQSQLGQLGLSWASWRPAPARASWRQLWRQLTPAVGQL